MPTMRPHAKTLGETIGTCEPTDVAWTLTLAAAASADLAAEADQFVAFPLGDDGQLRGLPPGPPDRRIAGGPSPGGGPLLPSHDPRHALVDLYLPFCSGTAGKP